MKNLLIMLFIPDGINTIYDSVGYKDGIDLTNHLEFELLYFLHRENKQFLWGQQEQYPLSPPTFYKVKEPEDSQERLGVVGHLSFRMPLESSEHVLAFKFR